MQGDVKHYRSLLPPPLAHGRGGTTHRQPQDAGPTGNGGGTIGTGNVPAAGETTFAGTPRAVAGAGEGGT